ncbi:TDT family transporter [Corallincola holothuriorum]|nr:TDT family transporter [Corallincola holothuriorum]
MPPTLSTLLSVGVSVMVSMTKSAHGAQPVSLAVPILEQHSSLETRSGGFVYQLARIPAPTGGVSLASFSLASALALAESQQLLLPGLAGFFVPLLLALGGFWLLPLLSKYLLQPRLLLNELAHPVLGSVLPTAAMAMMVAASWLVQLDTAAAQQAAVVLWSGAVALHAVLLIGFCGRQWRLFSLDRMVPSWFVPPIGIVVACVTAPAMGLELVAQPLFWFGLVAYGIKLPVMLYRLLFVERIPESALCTFAIMGAPASLLLAGYLSCFDTPNHLLVLLLAPIALSMTALVYLALIKLLQLPFSPGYAAFTFPLVIGATAQLLLSQWAQKNGMTELAELTAIAGLGELVVAAVMVLYVSGHYLSALFKSAF